ncbi:IS1595 family transposase [Sphingomonas sp.]|uniref:IS1595 family transposase n=1 Tax=Sphingomonas sp. TaxID=28214 RepID=UPI0038AE5DB4
MAQHFLLSARAKTLSTKQVARMSEEEAYAAFVKIRYAETDGEPFCPACGCVVVYHITAKLPSRGKNKEAEPGVRRLFKCKACDKQFSLTAGTIFAGRKLAIRDILYAIAKFANGAKGVSALQLSREMQCNYRTAFVLLHKLREAMKALQAVTLGGVGTEVEMDATYTGGYVKPAREKKNHRDARYLENQTGRKKCIITMVERGGRVLAFVAKSERQGLPEIMDRLEPGSIGFADEAKTYDALHAAFDMRRIDHSKMWASLDGVNTNQCESFHSRLKRSIMGVHHHIAHTYTENYVAELAWRETNRRISNGEQFLTIVAAGLHHPVSRQWKGYWQRHLRAAA